MPFKPLPQPCGLYLAVHWRLHRRRRNNYDHRGKPVSTLYMIPIKDFDAKKNFADLPSPGGVVGHVSIKFNAGHPGVPEPHYHIVQFECLRSGIREPRGAGGE